MFSAKQRNGRGIREHLPKVLLWAVKNPPPDNHRAVFGRIIADRFPGDQIWIKEITMGLQTEQN